MDDLACASCRKVLSLEEVERGNFKHLGGSLYCAECVAKMRRVGPTACAACGVTDTPLYNGKTYVCRKCGAELKREAKPKAEAPKPAPPPAEQAPEPQRAVKPCPYCNGIIPAHALKCRYCGSHLTREARDVESLSHQNLRLRFWLGSLLTASVFLILILAYLVSRPLTTAANDGPKPKPVPAEDVRVAQQENQIRELLAKIEALEAARAQAATPPTPRQNDEMAALRAELESMRRDLAATRKAPGPPPETPKKTPTEPPQKSPESPQPPAVAVKGNPPPTPAVTPHIAHPRPPTPPHVVDAAQPEDSPLSKQADAAYAGVEARARTLAADGHYGQAFVTCRGFIAEHLGTPAAGRAKGLLESLHTQLDGIRDEHARLFRQAAEKKDADAAGKVIEALALYDAPEVREDQAHMRRALQVLQEKPRQAVTRYLTQWKASPAIAKTIRDLQAEEALTRQNAAERLKREKDPAGIGPLIAALADGDWYVGTKALEALAAIGDPIALPAVARQTKAAHPVKYNKAAEVVESLARAPRDQYKAAWELVDTDQVVKEIVEALQLARQAEQDEQDGATISPSYQVALLKTLSHLKASGAEAVVRESLKSKHSEVRETAEAVLKALAS